MTWQALLGRYIEFAQASLAIPATDSGQRWRSAIPAIITLHAITCALNELHTLPRDEHALAIDRAAYLLDRHNREIQALWQPELPPAGVREIIEDAKASLARARGVVSSAASSEAATLLTAPDTLSPVSDPASHTTPHER